MRYADYFTNHQTKGMTGRMRKSSIEEEEADEKDTVQTQYVDRVQEVDAADQNKFWKTCRLVGCFRSLAS